MAEKFERINITLPPDVLEEFKKYGERKSVMISPFVAAKMRDLSQRKRL